MGMVQNPIQDCICDYCVIKDTVPVTEIDVCRKNRALFFVPFINQLEKEI